MRRCVFMSRAVLLLALLPALTACGYLNELFPDRTRDYKSAEPGAPLEVPPDLTTTPVTDALVVPSDSTTLSGYTSARESYDGGAAAAVLPDQDTLSLERHQDRAWLVVQGGPTLVWPRAREFWLENGFFIMREDPVTGILETDWQETRPSVPRQGVLRNLLGRVADQVYSSAYRDRYRMRLERGEISGTTELFITHQGVEEIVTDSEDGTTKWGARPKDPGLESEMLKRMMVYLGVAPARAEQLLTQQQPSELRAELIQQESGQATLVMHEDFSQAWRNVGIVLDRVDFAVEDRDRLQGIYYVRYSDPVKTQRNKGLLSKLAFWSKDDAEEVRHYQIKLSDDGADTRAVVLNSDGAPENSVTSVRILTLLYEELK